ncbi:hypothetical protein V8E52_005502 [Russula decolorans]
MPSKSLITSWTWTASFVPSGTRFSHSRREAYPGNSSVASPRRRVLLKHLHGLWKGTSSSRKRQLASDPMLRRVSSTISTPGVPGVTLASRPRPSPTASSLIFSPPSPTTPASLPSGVDTDSNAIKFSEIERRGILSDSFNDLSPTLLPFSGASQAEPALEPSYCRQPVSQSLSPSLLGHSPLPHPRRASTALATGCSTSGYTFDAATRLQDFRALIDELRSTLLHHDSKEEFDTGNGDEEDERERLLRLLEDVMRKVQQLAENDATRLGRLSP